MNVIDKKKCNDAGSRTICLKLNGPNESPSTGGKIRYAGTLTFDDYGLVWFQVATSFLNITKHIIARILIFF